MGSSLTYLVYLAVGLVISVCIFLILREVFCWYWKINEIKNLLVSIDTRLKEMKPRDSSKENVAEKNDDQGQEAVE